MMMSPKADKKAKDIVASHTDHQEKFVSVRPHQFQRILFNAYLTYISNIYSRVKKGKILRVPKRKGTQILLTDKIISRNQGRWVPFTRPHNTLAFILN